MPAFSKAIFAKVFPKTSVWSLDIFVITTAFGFITFVASSLPPNPVSKTALSTFFFLKY